MAEPLLSQIIRNQTEASMIGAICAGNTSLFHDLIRPYEVSAYKVAFCLLRNEADAEDVVQEAFLKSFQNLTKFRIESGFGTWLIGIVLNEARERSRKKKRTPMNSINEEIKASTSIATPVDQRGLPSQHFEQKETAALLSQAVFSSPKVTERCLCCEWLRGGQ